LILAIVAVVCALASYAHEGLANEVTEMARQNESYAKKNELLASQVTELGHIDSQFAQLQSSMGMSVDELESKLRTLHRITATSQLTAIFRAFTSIHCDCTGDGRKVQQREIHDFFDSVEPILRQAAPHFHFDEMVAEAEQQHESMGLPMMQLLVNAVIASSEQDGHQCCALLNLIMLALDPAEHLETTLDSAFVCLKQQGYTRDGLKAYFYEKWEASAEDSIECVRLLELSREIMLGSKPRGNRPLLQASQRS